jgi:Tfp pilus assembly protein PilN
MSAMRALSLNHPAPKGDAHRRLMNALLFIGLGCNIAGGFHYADLRNQREQAERLVAQPTARRAAQGGAGQVLQAEMARASDTLDALSLPWDEVFRALETASTGDVSLLALDPMPDKRMLKLQAEARNVEAMLAYLRALAGNAVFTAVSLQSHQVQQADPQHPVRFLVLVEWGPRP